MSEQNFTLDNNFTFFRKLLPVVILKQCREGLKNIELFKPLAESIIQHKQNIINARILENEYYKYKEINYNYAF